LGLEQGIKPKGYKVFHSDDEISKIDCGMVVHICKYAKKH
jgi:hypothetical protein